MGPEIQFELRLALGVGALLSAALLALMLRRLRRQGMPWWRAGCLTLLRAAVLAILVVLLARPVRVQSQDSSRRRAVAVLLDRSRSMALPEQGRTRFAQAQQLAAGLVRALETAGF